MKTALIMLVVVASVFAALAVEGVLWVAGKLCRHERIF